MQPHRLAVCREKHAVPPEQGQHLAAFLFHHTASRHTKQDPEGETVRPVGHHGADALGVHLQPVHLKIPAPAQQLGGAAGAVAPHPHGLHRGGLAPQVGGGQRLVDVQRPLVARLVGTVVVIQAVGQVGVLLNFRHQRARAQRVDGARLDVEHIVPAHRHLLQVFHHAALRQRPAQRGGVGVPVQAVHQMRVLRGVQHVPHFGLAQLAVLLPGGKFVAGMHLHR